MPQISGNIAHVNYANYWVEAVTKQSKHKQEAWDFLLFATAQENVQSYLKKTGKPTALKSLVGTQTENSELAPFAKQVLTADSWYQGNNFEYIEDVFMGMIKEVNNGSTSYKSLMTSAAGKINNGIY